MVTSAMHDAGIGAHGTDTFSGNRRFSINEHRQWSRSAIPAHIAGSDESEG